MKGRQMGTLNVIQTSGNILATKIFSKTGNQGPSWQLAQVQVPPSTNYTLTFEATVGSGFLSDIAIDDISVNDGICVQPGMYWQTFIRKSKLKTDQYLS